MGYRGLEFCGFGLATEKGLWVLLYLLLGMSWRLGSC